MDFEVSFRKTYAFVYFFGYSFLLVYVSFFPHAGTHSRCKACWMGHPKKQFNESSAGSDFGTVSKGIDLIESEFFRIRRIASTSFWQAFPIVWSRAKPVVSGRKS